MGQIAIAITKTVPFRGAAQPFTNTYHYGSVGLNPGEQPAQALIDEVVAIEQQLHTTGVAFDSARVWSSGGTISQNQMILEVSLSGTGSETAVAGIDPERAVLVQWDAGVDSLGRRVRLKKWYHSLGRTAGQGWTSAHIGQTTAFTTAIRNAIAAKADELTRIGGLNEWGLIAESGRERDGIAPVCHPWLEHHQLGDQWRA
jgi:hypothetical protein